MRRSGSAPDADPTRLGWFVIGADAPLAMEPAMHVFAAAGAGFLIAVLWFDLMFDVQAGRPGAVLAPDVLASISAYYRRVTTEASPMGRLVALVMLATIAAIVAGLALGHSRLWTGLPSLGAALLAVGLALARTVPTAVRLGRAADPPEHMTRLARQTLLDHRVEFVAMIAVLVLQLLG
jgi:hypothetical protein